MTLAAAQPVIEYLEDGVTLDFPVPFRFLSPSHIVARREVGGVSAALAFGADYTVVGGETDAGGTLTLVASPAGAVLTVQRVTPRDQQTDYQTNDTFPAETHERALDKLTAIAQETGADLADVESRALRVPPGETIDVLPALPARAGR